MTDADAQALMNGFLQALAQAEKEQKEKVVEQPPAVVHPAVKPAPTKVAQKPVEKAQVEPKLVKVKPTATAEPEPVLPQALEAEEIVKVEEPTRRSARGGSLKRGNLSDEEKAKRGAKVGKALIGIFGR